MPSDIITIAVDVPQPRVVGDRLAKTVSGKDWDLPHSDPGVYVEFVTNTAMQTPLPVTPEWLTTTTGDYARLRQAELSIAGSSAWTEFQRGYSGNYYMHSLGTFEKVYTSQSWDRNRPMWLSWVNYNTGNEVFCQMICGWGEGTGAAVELQFFSDGSVEVYRNLDKIGDAKINEVIFYPTPYGPESFKNSGKSGRQLANDTIDVMLIPSRQREILVLSNQGGGFNFVFEDIEPTDDDPTLTGAGPFYFYVPSGQATVQVAPLKFSEGGTLLSPVFSFREAPPTGTGFTVILNGNGPGYGDSTVSAALMEEDGLTPFVANGSLSTGRLAVEFSSSGDSTSFVYTASTAFFARTAESEDSETDIGDFWAQATLDVPEDPSNVKVEIECLFPEAMEAAGATDIRGTGNRDIVMALGSLWFFIGRTLDPKWEEAPSDYTRSLTLEVRDRTVIQERYLIQDPESVDGLNISDAIAFFAEMPGFGDTDMDIGGIDYNLPIVGQNSNGESNFLPQVGDSPLFWIHKLWEEFAQKVYWGWVPTADGVKFRFKTPEQLGDTSQATLYLTDAEAQIGGELPGNYTKWVYDWKPRVLVPEANDIYVVGRDPRSLLPIIAHYRDTDSADPTLPAIDRPDNWIGELRQYSWVDPSLATDADVTWALNNFIDVLPVKRRVVEFRCQFLVRPDGAPVWRGDVVTIVGAGTGYDGLWRIKTLSALFDLEYSDPVSISNDRIWRETTYVAERLRNQ